MNGNKAMATEVPDNLLPLFRVLARQHLEDMRAQLHLMGAGHPQAGRALEELARARELARVAGVPMPAAA